MTSFACGCFAMGISRNHITYDGRSSAAFWQNLAALAGGGQLVTVPFNDRELLSGRSPPQVTFSHLELAQAPAASSPSPAKLHSRTFRLSAGDVATLKLLAQPLASRPTTFNVAVAHIWRCRVLSDVKGGADPERVSRVLYAVDIRARLRPPLPAEYTGNAVLTAYGEATAGEVKEGPFGRLVEAVAEGAARMSDAYVRSAIDWSSMHRGYPEGDLLLSSWWRLGLADAEYPWGKPAYVCPVGRPRRDMVLLLPGIAGADNAINALVTLPREDMERFTELFYRLVPLVSCL